MIYGKIAYYGGNMFMVTDITTNCELLKDIEDVV